ncbi:MAG: hypothetical protein AB9897_04075 [Anaerolineaceae bacterium]
MERIVPRFTTDEIELYLRTVYSLLRSTNEVQIRTLEEVHAGMNSSMHMDARKTSPDTSAFIYAILRLPDCIRSVKSVILGQSYPVFVRHGYADIENWQPVSARARRRLCYFDGQETLACFIASQSDIEDVIPVLTAYQIEWNKINLLLQRCSPADIDNAMADGEKSLAPLAKHLEMSTDDLSRLKTIWGSDSAAYLHNIADRRCDFGILLLSGSLSEYWRATRIWWDNIELAAPEVLDRPVYFVSSNTHSIVNLLSGFALSNRDEIIHLLTQKGDKALLHEWQEIQESKTNSNLENFLYYAQKKVQQIPDGSHLIQAQLDQEKSQGIKRIPPAHSFDIETQVIDLNRLDLKKVDPRLLSQLGDLQSVIQKTNAIIINIDYPLGFGAYHILTKLAEHVSEILGVYILGKAATLNGVRGDVMIPNVVQDEHSENTYLFKNAFDAANVQPYLVYGTVLDNQKALTALGTFLQNARLTDVVYRDGYTDIEMEAGPYLSAVYEMFRPIRHPVNEIVNLYGLPFDVGILHYASDTPLSKGKNLGAAALSYEGMDSTYATSVAVLRRILSLEQKRLLG